jgi:3-dehydroquinate synthase
MHNINFLPERMALAEMLITVTGNLVVLMDENTHRLCYPLVLPALPQKHHVIVIGAGEQHKNIKTSEYIWKQLQEVGADRKSMLLNIGGGMVTDIGGFAAATFMRGISFVNIPTTLLGMVDASIGGKNGIDLGAFKNLVGTFKFPDQVAILSEFLDTLPDKEWNNGMAEVIKHAVLTGGKLWNDLKQVLLNNEINSGAYKLAISKLLPAIIQVKARIVNADPEEKGDRIFLNYGHTIGHGLESYSLAHESHPLSHGEAVMMGMICEGYLSNKFCDLSMEELQSLIQVIKMIHFIHPVKGKAIPEIMKFVKSDKKRSLGTLSLPLLKHIGTPIVINGVSENDMIDSIHFYNSLAG